MSHTVEQTETFKQIVADAQEVLTIDDQVCRNVAIDGLVYALHLIDMAEPADQMRTLPIVEQLSLLDSDLPEQTTLREYVAGLKHLETQRKVNQFETVLDQNLIDEISKKIGSSGPLSLESILEHATTVAGQESEVTAENIVITAQNKLVKTLGANFGKWQGAQSHLQGATGESRKIGIEQSSRILGSVGELLKGYQPETRDKIMALLHKRIKQEQKNPSGKKLMEFTAAVVNESVVFDLLTALAAEESGWQVSRGSVEQDTDEGTDFIVETSAGKVSVDAKSRGSFDKLFDDKKTAEKIDDKFGIKHFELDDGTERPVLVVNVEGANNRDSILLDNIDNPALPGFRTDEAKTITFRAAFKQQILKLLGRRS